MTTDADTAFQWANRRGWNIPDTEFARQALAVFAKVSTGLHNLYGDYACDPDEIDPDVYPEPRPVQAYPHGVAIMRCTNPLNERFITALVGSGLRYEIGSTRGLSAEFADTDFGSGEPDEPNEVLTDDWGNPYALRFTDTFPDGTSVLRVFPVRVYTTVVLWP